MWSALRSDLSEFVNTVTGETAEALNKIDSNFPDKRGDEETTPAEEEALRRMALEETYTTPLIPEKEEIKKEKEEEAEEETDVKEKSQDSNSQDGEVEEDAVEESDEEEVSEDVKEFVASFSIDSKTDEIALLLEVHPETVKANFESLVPTAVKYEDFWMRFFYRCDANRIQAEWDAEEAAAKEARAQAVQQGLSTVRNFLGGAVKAVSSTLSEGDAAKASGAATKLTSNQAQKVASAYFGSAGRPPFVMNTAVSEDDYDGEEEEELGWDDDEDEEDFEPQSDDANEESVDTEQIEFNDAVTEKLQEELKQALAERDSLQQTVTLQQKEIASLKSEGNSSEIEHLKTELFEKKSEIAALRASLWDSPRKDDKEGADSRVALLESEIERLNLKLHESEAATTAALSKYEESKQQLEEKSAQLEDVKSRLEEISLKNDGLEKYAQEMKDRVSVLEAENVKLGKALNDAEKRAMQADNSGSEIASVQQELEEMKAALLAAEQSKQEMAAELQKLKDSLQAKEEAAKIEDETKSVDSPDTMSTGIKIEPPAVEKLDEEAAVEDGWDDDW